MVSRHHCQFQTAVYTDLVENPRQVMFDRVFTDAEVHGDVSITHRFTDSLHDFQLPSCKTELIFHCRLRDFAPRRRFFRKLDRLKFSRFSKPLDEMIRRNTAHPNLATCNGTEALAK